MGDPDLMKDCLFCGNPSRWRGKGEHLSCGNCLSSITKHNLEYLQKIQKFYNEFGPTKQNAGGDNV